MYQGRCVGRILNFLQETCGCLHADQWTFHSSYSAVGKSSTTLTDENIVCIYRWVEIDGVKDIPDFIFFNEFKHYNETIGMVTREIIKREKVIAEDKRCGACGKIPAGFCVKKCISCGSEEIVGNGVLKCSKCKINDTMFLTRYVDEGPERLGRCIKCRRPRYECRVAGPETAAVRAGNVPTTGICGLCDNGNGPPPFWKE